MTTIRYRAWPAAKYLTYCLWRAWILVVYSAPLWTYFGRNDAGAYHWMYALSTIAFTVVAFALAFRWQASERLLDRNAIMIGAGSITSAGVILEYVGVYLLGSSATPPFFVGAILTGIGTAFISIRSGQIYSATNASIITTNTALAETAAGLTFFFAIGTVPLITLTIGAILPLMAAAMACLGEKSFKQGRTPISEQKNRSSQHKEHSAFIRFLVVVFALTMVATLTRNYSITISGSDASTLHSIVGISFVIALGFLFAIVACFVRSFSIGAFYYPLVLILAIALILTFSAFENTLLAGATIIFVYSVFSLLLWVLLSFLAKSDTWSPVQVFGYGRGVFALGSVVGWAIGIVLPDILEGRPEDAALGVILAFLLIALSMLVFRESDARRICGAVSFDGDANHESLHWHGDLQDQYASPAFGAKDDFHSDEEITADTNDEQKACTLEDFLGAHHLSAREREVFALMLTGRDARTIAAQLVISENTAKAHIRNIYAKTGVHTRQEFISATEHLR